MEYAIPRWSHGFGQVRRNANHAARPTAAPTGSKEEHWLEAHDGNLLEIIQTVLGGADSESYQNYLQNYENPPNPVLYKRIFYRTLALAELTSTPH